MILLRNCYLAATFNEHFDEFENIDILIKGSIIEKMGKNISLAPEDSEKTEIIDCSNLLVMPGMVNTHHHFFQTLTRNLKEGQNAKLFDWLIYHYPIWAGLHKDAVYFSTLLATAELLKTGATCSTDHMYLYPEGFEGDIMKTQFDAAERTGIRFSPTRGSMTRGKSQGGLPPDSVVQKSDAVIDDMIRTIETFHDSSGFSMKKVVLAPCSPFSVEEKVMIKAAEIARKYNVNLHTHLAETLDENDYCLEKYTKRPLAVMEEWGWTGPDVFFAHGIWFNDNELKLLADTRTGVAHCPSSNMRLGSGIARVKEMIEMGIPIGLGVDGSASNDTSDMLGEVRNALLLQRVKYGSDAVSARDVFKLAVHGGHTLLGNKKNGMLKEGYAADMALFDMSQLQYAGSQSDPLASLVFCGFNHGTRYTIVNGNIAVRDGILTGFDEREITENVNRISKELINNI